MLHRAGAMNRAKPFVSNPSLVPSDQVLGICRCQRYEAQGKVGKAHRETSPIKVRAAGPAPGNAVAFGLYRNNQQAAVCLNAHAAKCGGTRRVRGIENARHRGRT